MKKKFRVLLPIEIDGRIYEFGSTVELDLETALLYSHALMACEEEVEDGGHK
jgi:hypothetical protein